MGAAGRIIERTPLPDGHEGVVEWQGRHTWYRVVGDLDERGSKAPTLLLHGGPGAAHDYLVPIAGLAREGRPCILYDQYGNGRSDHARDADPASWTVELFKDELETMTRTLGVDDRYHLIGQSWGGMLAMEHALEHPRGLVSMVVANSPASMRLWVAEANRLRAALPPDVQEALTRHEADGTTDSAEYEAAVDVFYRRYLCRLDPWPDDLVRGLAAIAADPTVYHTMNGPSEFHTIGSLRDWDITDRLVEISTPTLLISGGWDEATPHIVEQIHNRIPGSEWVLLQDGSHSTHLEFPGRFRALCEEFLGRAESG